MKERKYFSERTGKNPKIKELDLPTLKKIFVIVFDSFFSKDYFRDQIGYIHWDNRRCVGSLGGEIDINNKLFLELRKENLWPIEENIEKYSEDDLFDIMEFCFDNISIPQWCDGGSGYPDSICGYDEKTAQNEYRAELNKFLKDYGEGYELDESGCIVQLSGFGLDNIFKAEVPTEDEKVLKPVEHAISKFRNRNSTREDRREAVRSLCDVLEYMRPLVKDKISKKDEKDLFLIMNGFGIRHHKMDQQTNYDEKIYLSWMFYLYLSSIHAFVRIINGK